MDSHEKNFTSQQPIPPANWHGVKKLLEARQYSQAGEIFQSTMGISQLSNDSIFLQYLNAANNLCQMCRQSQEDIAWHQRICEEAHQREEEIREQLEQLVDLMMRQAPTPESQYCETLSREPGTKRWQHFLHHLNLIIGWKKGSALLPDKNLHAGTQESPSEADVSSGLPINEPEKALSPSESSPPGLALPSLSIHCLGSFRVYQGDQLINNWPSGKGKAILKYMIANCGRPVFKDVLLDTFWRDADPEAARKNLYVAIHGLRQAFKILQPDFPHILFYDDHYFLNPDIEVWIDMEEFTKHFQAGQSLERRGALAEAMQEYEAAQNLYSGDFLEDDLYDDWVIPLRQNLRENYLITLDHLSRYYLDEKRYRVCIQFCQNILSRDDCQEDAHRRLICCYSRQGKRSLALRQYQICVETLQRELGVAPMPETTGLYQRICSGEAV